MKSVILASASSRRKEMLEEIGLSFKVCPAHVEEKLDENLSVEEAISHIAYAKANDVFQQHTDAVVIACDTMVCIDGKALGKPRNQDDARKMLKMLSGKTHQVISGVSIITDEEVTIFHEVTDVTFYKLTEDSIQAYLSTDEPYDKAGGYGIQGKGKLFVKEIKGDYYNVVGLPIAKVYQKLMEIQVKS